MSLKYITMATCLSVFSLNVNAQIVTFSGDNSSGFGNVGGNSFAWAASPGLINTFDNPTDFGWGRISDPTSQGFNLTITMDFDTPWTFNSIQFEALNTVLNDNVFSVQLFDSSLNTIDISNAQVSTSSGYGAAPWSYNEINNSWDYATFAGSINGHQAAITSQYNNVSRLMVTVDDHLGLDYFNLDLSPTTVPIPAAFWLFGSGLIGLVGLTRRKA